MHRPNAHQHVIVHGPGEGSDAADRVEGRYVETVHLEGDQVTLGMDLLARLRTRVLPVYVSGHEAGRVAAMLCACGIPAAPLTEVPAPIAPTMLELIGRTPLVALTRLFDIPGVQVLAKLEMLNPGGSTKDRAALYMVDAAERAGLLKPGGTIVEPTSGNTGVGLAMIAAQRGYRCVFTVPDKVAPEKIALLRAYGAEVKVCPTAVPPDDERSYYTVARHLTQSIPGAYSPNQYANPANPDAHFATTGPEIEQQTHGAVTHFVAGVGTGGTIGGVGRYLKSRNPAVRIVAADPEGSVYSGGDGSPYLVEGIGEDFWPGNYDAAVIDEVLAISDAESFTWTRRCAQVEGLLVGGSCGAALAAADRVARSASPGSLVVVLLPDSGRGYLSKVYNDTWIDQQGFHPSVRGAELPAGLLVCDVELAPLRCVPPEATVSQAAAVLAGTGAEIAVIGPEHPRLASQLTGSVRASDLLDAVLAGWGEDPLSCVARAALPVVGIHQELSVALGAMTPGVCAVVCRDGQPVGLLEQTRALSSLLQG